MDQNQFHLRKPSDNSESKEVTQQNDPENEYVNTPSIERTPEINSPVRKVLEK